MLLTLALVALFSLGAAADAPKSGWYKIQNLKTGGYVKVLSKTYAKPNADEAAATPIYVGVGEEWLADENGEWDAENGIGDGSFKVTSLMGEGVEVYDYVIKCVNLAYAFIDIHLTNPNAVTYPLTDEEVELAKETVKYYADNAAFMRIRPIGSSYYAIATIPSIPQWVEDAAIEHGVTDGAWSWAKRQVLSRLDRLEEFGLGGFEAIITNNLNNIEPGKTYYLTADEDGTFGYMEEENVTPRTQEAKWNMVPYEFEVFAESGYYRIRNAAGVNGKAYVNVDGRYTAEPDATAEEAVTEPGTVIYVGMEGIPNNKTKITALSGQSDDVIAYANHAVDLAYQFALNAIDEYTQDAQSSSIQQIRDELPGIFKSYIDRNMAKYGYLYLVPDITSDGKDAVYCQVTLPGMKELDETVANIFHGESGYTISADFPGFFITDPNLTDANGNHPIVGLDTAYVWNFAVDELIKGLKARGSDPAIIALVENNMHNVVTGHTYALTQDPDSSFGYVDVCDENGGRDEAMLAELGDAGKWVLEPVVNDGNYFAVDPTISGKDEDGNTKYVTTLYTDFPYTLSEGMKAYKVTGAEEQEGMQGLVITKEEVASPVPANMAVLLICDQAGAENNKLEPVAPAAEEEDPTAEPSGAPRRVVSTQYDVNNGNLLYANHFDGTAGNKSLMALGNTDDGVAFCEGVSNTDGNVPALDITNLDVADAYYIFPVEEEEEPTAIDAINGKTVTSVRYINVAGMQSDKAFDGVNVVVTTYNDGTKVITKVVK